MPALISPSALVLLGVNLGVIAAAYARFSDLGNLRNVVAYNGVIAEQMQFKRVELAFHDWTKQISG